MKIPFLSKWLEKERTNTVFIPVQEAIKQFESEWNILYQRGVDDIRQDLAEYDAGKRSPGGASWEAIRVLLDELDKAREQALWAQQTATRPLYKPNPVLFECVHCSQTFTDPIRFNEHVTQALEQTLERSRTWQPPQQEW